jgi:hypothetical protein
MARPGKPGRSTSRPLAGLPYVSVIAAFHAENMRCIHRKIRLFTVLRAEKRSTKSQVVIHLIEADRRDMHPVLARRLLGA